MLGSSGRVTVGRHPPGPGPSASLARGLRSGQSLWEAHRKNPSSNLKVADRTLPFQLDDDALAKVLPRQLVEEDDIHRELKEAYNKLLNNVRNGMNNLASLENTEGKTRTWHHVRDFLMETKGRVLYDSNHMRIIQVNAPSALDPAASLPHSTPAYQGHANVAARVCVSCTVVTLAWQC